MKDTRRLAPLLVLIVCVAALPASAAAALQDDPPPQPLFDAEDPLELTLAGDLRPIFKDKGDDRPYRPAHLHLHTETDDTVSFDISVKTRGFYRRKYLDCDVPPLRLNFKKKQVEETVFANQDKLKLVTHCKNKIDAYEQYALQEYLIYKSYNLLTDNSFRVRLVHITYIDTEGRRKPITKYGFLIEDEDRLAERLGGRNLETGIIHQEKTDKVQATRLALFQFMIGNTDWSVPAHHNIKFVYRDPQTPPLAVPYDFDMAGLINTPYAEPDPKLGIRTVRDRLFRGYCRTDEDFEAIFAEFNAQQEATYALFNDFPYLDKKPRKRAIKYLDEFYETINKPRRVRREILAVCLRE